MRLHGYLAILGAAALIGGAGCRQGEPPDWLAGDAYGQAQAKPEKQKQGDRRAETRMREMDRGPTEHTTFRTDDIPWRDAPPSLPSGAQVAVLEGDPGQSGVFTIRIQMPDGYEVPPHWHANVERVTVLRGRFLLGMGEQMDRGRAEALAAGAYATMPKKMVHYAMAEGETVIQITSVGPWEITYVRPEDDPRRRERERAPRR